MPGEVSVAAGRPGMQKSNTSSEPTKECHPRIQTCFYVGSTKKGELGNGSFIFVLIYVLLCLYFVFCV
jgi:hypothetical protein